MKILRQAPFIRLVLFLIIGIIFQTYSDFSLNLLQIICVFSIIIVGVAFIPTISRNYNLRYLFGIALFLLCFSVGGLLTDYCWKNTEWNESQGLKTYQAQIIDEPVRKPKTWMCKVSLNNGKKAIIYIPLDTLSSTLIPGDILEISADFTPVEQSYIKKQGIAARSFIRKGDWHKIKNVSETKFNLRFQALKYRRILLDRLKILIPDSRSYSVAAALIFGYKNELDPVTRQTFAATGTAHVLAVSGLHFSIIYGMFYFLFSFLGNSLRGRIIRQLIILPLMWVFAFLTGLGPSVVRAAIMLSVWGIGSAFFVKAFTVNTLSIAAFLMLLYNPLYLFDVGFQLSFSAVFAILMINPFLIGLYETQNRILQYLWGLCTVSTSAQVGTAPLSIYYFHQFPLIYFVTNIFAIPIVGVLLFLIPVSLLLQFLLGNYSIIMYPVNKLLLFFISGLESLERIPNALVSNIDLTRMDVFSMSLFIIFFFLLVIKKRVAYLYSLIIVAVFQLFYYLCRL